ncbi:MAG: thioredoxin fold domain-containing protein [Muribaculaceae bacterium]|nr:thioredoxin fold domain-containing protein [Muribaculaceae bacterium]
MKKFLLAAVVAIISITAFAQGNSVKELNDKNFQELLGDPNGPVVIDFSASWCGPCKTFAPVFHQVADEMSGKAEFFKVDVDESPQLASAMRIQAGPTIILINPGTEKIDIIQGVVGKDEFVKRVKAIL